MKILLAITTADSIGGAQLYVRDLADRLRRDRHDVLVVTGAPGALTAMLAERGIPTIACPHLQRSLHPVRDVRAIRALGRIIRDFGPDLVSAHSSKAGTVARIASRLNGVPCVFTAHGWAFAEGVREPGRTLWRVIERATERLATRIICVSRFDRELAIRSGFDPARLVTIHNGIGVAPAAPTRREAQAGPVRIAMVARFFPQKDHRSLIQAIQAIPECVLDLVGDGPLQAAMEAYATEIGVRNRVHFHGYRSDVSDILAQASIFALTSHHEGFPLTTLEAMRAGLPAIVSDVGGAGEAVTDGVTGYLTPRGDVAAIRSRLRLLLDQPSLRRQMGESARTSYARSFTFDRMYEATLAVYREAATPRRAGQADPTTPGVTHAFQRIWRSPWG